MSPTAPLLTWIQRLLVSTEASSDHAWRLSLPAAVFLLVGVPMGLAACESQHSSTDTNASLERGITVERIGGGGMPIQQEGDADTVGHSNPEIERLEDVTLLRRYNGRMDTLDLTRPKSDIESLDGGGYLVRRNVTFPQLDGHLDDPHFPKVPDAYCFL